MVLMLRSQGIPARLVTGFLGGEYNPFEGYYIVRDNNAHAWVEAYLPGTGWHDLRSHAAGRPAGRRQRGSVLLAQQAWDFMIFRWDRYVLTFGLYDQLRIFGGLRELWDDFWAHFKRDEKAEKRDPLRAGPRRARPRRRLARRPPGPAGRSAPPLAHRPHAARRRGPGLLYLRHAPAADRDRRLPPPPAAPRPGGAALADSVPPLAVRREAAARYPGRRGAAARVIDFYLRESFGGQALEDEELEDLKTALEEAEKNMRKAG